MNTAAQYFMQRCLQLAKKGINTVAPNPMVGCVITIPHNSLPFGEIIIGEGYHKKFGEPHAEVNAVASVKDKSLLKMATAYVSLEPCSHFGKTPPCANLLIDSGIKKVVVAGLDPNPKVAGSGITMLKQAGIEVIVNVLQTEAWQLNRRFYTFFIKKRPYVVLKWAQTANGFISDSSGEPKMISNPQSLQIVHQIRSQEQAIMVAKNTVLTDNPSLSTRNWAGKSPLRVVLDSHLSIPKHYKVLTDEQATLVFNNEKNEQNGPTTYLNINPKNLDSVLQELFNRNILSVLVEGGSQILQSFIDKKLWDEAFVFISQNSFDKGIKAPAISNCNFISNKIDDNIIQHYKNS